MSKDKVARWLDLQDKASSGVELTKEELNEAEELTAALTLPGQEFGAPMATENQKTYINVLLESLGDDLEDYSDTGLDELTLEDASLLIDELKEKVTEYGLWD